MTSLRIGPTIAIGLILLLIAAERMAAPSALAADGLPPGVVCLLDENAGELLPKLTNPGGDGGEGEVERGVVFSGREAIKITAYQKYSNAIPGWAHRIRENPHDGEYRFLRFAWKSAGVTGIMLQLHDEKDWCIRYTSGANKFGWATQTVSQTVPDEWTVVTIDLFKDFGEREIRGMALTAFDGVAHFDHIYLARNIEELDRIDVTGLWRGRPIKLASDEVEKHWQTLASADGAAAYRSFWTLAAGGDSAKELLRAKLGASAEPVDEPTVQKWLKQLDDEEFDVREEATSRLSAHFLEARKLIEDELKRTQSPEVRARLGMIVAAADVPQGETERRDHLVRRIVQIIVEREKG